MAFSVDSGATAALSAICVQAHGSALREHKRFSSAAIGSLLMSAAVGPTLTMSPTWTRTCTSWALRASRFNHEDAHRSIARSARDRCFAGLCERHALRVPRRQDHGDRPNLTEHWKARTAYAIERSLHARALLGLPELPSAARGRQAPRQVLTDATLFLLLRYERAVMVGAFTVKHDEVPADLHGFARSVPSRTYKAFALVERLPLTSNRLVRVRSVCQYRPTAASAICPAPRTSNNFAIENNQAVAHDRWSRPGRRPRAHGRWN